MKTNAGDTCAMLTLQPVVVRFADSGQGVVARAATAPPTGVSATRHANEKVIAGVTKCSEGLRPAKPS